MFVYVFCFTCNLFYDSNKQFNASSVGLKTSLEIKFVFFKKKLQEMGREKTK